MTAASETTATNPSSAFRREIRWEPGYDYRNDPEKSKYGAHGMNIRWLLHGELGTIQFLIYSMWLPSWSRPGRWGNEIRTEGFKIHAPMAADLGFHWRTPRYWQTEDFYTREHCMYIDAPCSYDGSGLNAEPVFAALLTTGEEAVWSLMAEYYDVLATETEQPSDDARESLSGPLQATSDAGAAPHQSEGS